MTDRPPDNPITRRDVLAGGARWAALAGAAAIGVTLGRRAIAGDHMVWQIDPRKCVQCGNCETKCVLKPSAVKCTQLFAICGYCNLCTGYFVAQPHELTSAAENQICPTGAIVRRFLVEPYWEYTIDESRCVGCGKCVKGCFAFGNGSMILQVRHDRCVNCNQCAIAAACPAGAFSRVPASSPSLMHLRLQQMEGE
jgi:electron transport complex protein RnfB